MVWKLYNKNTANWARSTVIIVHLFQPGVEFYLETSHLFCSANTGLKLLTTLGWNWLTWTQLAYQTIATIPIITKKVQSKHVYAACKIYWGINSFMM